MKNSGTIATIIGLVLVLVYLGWLRYGNTPAEVGVYMPAQVAPQVKPVPKVEVEIKRPVKVYHSSAKTSLKLPAAVIADKDTQVLEATKVAVDTHAHTVTTLINTETGETTTLDRREPLPWLAFRRSGALRMDYDFIRSLSELSVRQDFVQVKDVVLDGKLALKSNREFSAIVGVEWRW